MRFALKAVVTGVQGLTANRVVTYGASG